MVHDLEAAREGGINCLALAYLIELALYDYQLPRSLRCYELFKDEEHVTTVPRGNEQFIGDMYWHGPADVSPDQFVPEYDATGYLSNWRSGPAQHISVLTGWAADGEPLVMHASDVAGKTCVWRIGQFESYPRHRAIHRIGRLATIARV